MRFLSKAKQTVLCFVSTITKQTNEWMNEWKIWLIFYFLKCILCCDNDVPYKICELRSSLFFLHSTQLNRTTLLTALRCQITIDQGFCHRPQTKMVKKSKIVWNCLSKWFARRHYLFLPNKLVLIFYELQLIEEV